LRHTPPSQRRIALMLSAYPTKHSRVGNAVGLDTPASAVELLRRMRDAGYDLGPDAFPGVEPTGTDQPDGDALIHALIAAGGQDPYGGRGEECGAHAGVHRGKHGSLEWLPGKTAGLSASCAPDAVLGNLPLVYPFLINDPGEGAQAKRRAHATIVDHLIPPMA